MVAKQLTTRLIILANGSTCNTVLGGDGQKVRVKRRVVSRDHTHFPKLQPNRQAGPSLSTATEKSAKSFQANRGKAQPI